MKIVILSVCLALVPYVVMASVFCEECLYDLDFSNKTNVLSCLATVAVGIIIRAIEKRRLKKGVDKSNNNENSDIK